MLIQYLQMFVALWKVEKYVISLFQYSVYFTSIFFFPGLTYAGEKNKKSPDCCYPEEPTIYSPCPAIRSTWAKPIIGSGPK